MRGLIVTGTDTGIGKTVLAAGLVGRLGARYWKPVQSGLEEETDSECIARLVPGTPVHPEAYRLITPASPHWAARLDGVTIDPARLALPQGDGPLVVEGAGGALVPLTETRLYADQFADWGLPVVVAARTALGTINHTLLTVEALRARGCAILGLAFIGDAQAAEEESMRFLCAHTGLRRLGHLPRLDPLTPDTLAAAMADFDL
ncbi:dethiobiotin synthase [Novosphingobium sp. KACC 22771]|uniref:dethiobiotin synthase n=1 Tax=Novosphingobium sp. KACC 22771 TaxID=3025670 RepID=UPI00236648A7|nr:dethiobiotin synthase [Novosphingobium sp. KACC 22771]WDF72932.1 dethiobiotin synthase [Novosphingobium sp. KACC 22771]